MQVDHDVGARDQNRLEVMGDHLAGRAARIAGEQTVEVPAIDGRGPKPGARRRGVGHRKQDDLPPYRLRRELPREGHKGGLPLVFVAVNPGGQQDHRPFAVPDRDDGQSDPAIGAGMGGMRNAKEPGVPTVLSEVYIAGDHAVAGHAVPSLRPHCPRRMPRAAFFFLPRRPLRVSIARGVGGGRCPEP